MSHQITFEEFSNYCFSSIIAGSSSDDKELKCVVSPTEGVTVYIVKHKDEITYTGLSFPKAIEAYNSI